MRLWKIGALAPLLSFGCIEGFPDERPFPDVELARDAAERDMEIDAAERDAGVDAAERDAAPLLRDVGPDADDRDEEPDASTDADPSPEDACVAEAEICDGRDNDCDGVIDNDLYASVEEGCNGRVECDPGAEMTATCMGERGIVCECVAAKRAGTPAP